MTAWTILGTLVIAIAAFVLFSGYLKTLIQFRGTRVITCPENLQPAAVKVNAQRAARWAAIAGEPDVRLRACSRWPDMAGCGQECLSQITASPDGCALKTLVARWYAGKSCHYCARPIGEIVWHERPPALLTKDKVTREWKSVKPEELPRLFASAEPVCWVCHIVESFRHEHAELVIERVRLAEPEPGLKASVAVY